MLVRCENNVHDRNGSITQKIFFVCQRKVRITFLRTEKENDVQQKYFSGKIFLQKISCTHVCFTTFLCMWMRLFLLYHAILTNAVHLLT